MNRLYLLFIFCLSLVSASADWDLFPLNQKTYYQYTEVYSGIEKINFISFDTVVQRSGFQSVFLNRRYSGNGNGQCYTEVTDLNNYLPGYGWMNIEMDSLIYTGDTVRYSPEIYFLPKKSIGESWRTSGSFYNGFTDIEFTCTSITLQSFLGITDSVKEFTLATYNGASPVTSQLSGYVIKLSKNYGLLDYLGFDNLERNQGESHLLIGFNDSSGVFGFRAPNYLDFFPYKVGDILNWLTEVHNPFPVPYTYNYFRDSIINVTITSDSLKYISIRQSYSLPAGVYAVDTSEQRFLVNYFKSIIECPPNWLAINPDNASVTADISISDSYILESDGSISYRILWDGTRVDTSDCQISQASDISYHYIYNTKQGHTEYCDDAFYYNCTKLIGSCMDGIVYGDTSFITGIESISQVDLLKIYPSPAEESFFLEVEKPNGSLSIITHQGIVCRQLDIVHLKTEVNIADLSGGLYLIRYVDGIDRQFVKHIVHIH